MCRISSRFGFSSSSIPMSLVSISHQHLFPYSFIVTQRSEPSQITGCPSLLRPRLTRGCGLRRFVSTMNPCPHPGWTHRPAPDPHIGLPPDPLVTHFAPPKLIYIVRGPDPRLSTCLPFN